MCQYVCVFECSMANVCGCARRAQFLCIKLNSMCFELICSSGFYYVLQYFIRYRSLRYERDLRNSMDADA